MLKDQFIIFLLTVSFTASSFAQKSIPVAHIAESGNHIIPESDSLDQIFANLDSLLFSVAFNQCDTAVARKLISPDFEFYHDLGGVLDSSEVMIRNFQNTCNGNYRKLEKGSLVHYRLLDRGHLYGMVQHGKHGFYRKVNGIPSALEMTAQFTHLWLLVEGKWKLHRVLSYDHQRVPTGN